jgi:ADP-ribosyl-[dinitrogen reductase] hydrolase
MLTLSQFRGCLLAGAAGDALGAPLEFLSSLDIETRFGRGVRDYEPAYGRKGAITDDTQMTLFTAEAVLRHLDGSGGSLEQCLREAYLNWFRTQTVDFEEGHDGMLGHRELWSRRAPGNTCMTALDSIAWGREPRNDSKGCGGVMRAAPLGLALEPEEAYQAGKLSAELTHRHQDGYAPAGVLAMLVSKLVRGERHLRTAIDECLGRLAMDGIGKGTLLCAQRAINQAESGRTRHDWVIRDIGAGWTGDEALAIAIYALLVGQTLEEALVIAANHDGDTDSTAAIAGNIAGAALGEEVIPERWLLDLELGRVVAETAERLYESQASAAAL